MYLNALAGFFYFIVKFHIQYIITLQIIYVLGARSCEVRTEFDPRSRRNLLICKRSSIAHSLSLAYSHPPDMTETLLKRM